MSRNKSLRNREPEGRMESFGRADNFDRLERQLMKGFGGLDDDFFGGMLSSMDSRFDSMFNFSDLHQKMHRGRNEGAFVCQTFVSSSKMGPDGKMITENYYENNLGHHRNGNTISQKQQAYKNSAGVNRLAEQRMLNDKGRKVVKEKRGNDIEQTNHYFNMEEEQRGDFDRDWQRINEDTKFLDQYGKYLGYKNALTGPRRQQIRALPLNEDVRSTKTGASRQSWNSKKSLM